ncbi:alpha-galactosidase [Propioniciclava soli]|uniref:Alpha-galactosidase n=1 Tax=Propioniciclava soli TaxID=2775081 RepID=A0ABZ3CB98_9ACTN
MTSPLRFTLRAAGVSLVLDASDGHLPTVLHWGADLGAQDADALAQLAAAVAPTPLPNGPDAPVRVALVPEQASGWVGRPGLTGWRDGGVDWSPRWRVTDVASEGTPIRDGADLGAAAVTVTASDAEAGLILTLEVELTPQGLARARASVANDAATDYHVGELLVAFPVPRRAREILDLAGSWGAERHPQRRALTVGVHLREGRHGRTGADAATILHVGEPGFGFARGEVWGVHTAWSGNHVHYAERDASGHQLIGGGALLLPGEGRLGPGASHRGPWVYFSHGVGLDAVARRFHRWLRARPQHPDRARPVTLNVWEAVYFDHDLDRLRDLADRAAALGIERFVLDDGWFGSRREDTSGLGDWVVSAQVWPDGLGPLVDHVTGLGLQFGLWVEPEMVNPDSDVARAHPEWLLQPGHGRLPVEARHQQVLNLGIPAAYAHVRDQLMALLGEYAIAYLKWDHNRDLVEAGTAPGGAPGVRAQTLAAYRLMDELKAAHPGLEIEACSSGGARVDLEVLQRCDRVWVSDCIDPLERQTMLRWTGQLLPPELLGSHIASGRSHTTGRVHDLSFRAATAVFGHLGVEWDLAQASDDEIAELGAWISWWKANREHLLGGDLVRVDTPDADVWIHGVVTPERGVFAVTPGRIDAVTNLGDVVLPGLDPDADYDVSVVRVGAEPPVWGAPAWFGGVRLSGRALASVGVRFPAMAPDHTVLVDAVRT